MRGNDELAAIMTYIRRGWENNADPVDASEVLRVKRATAGRLAPWTIAELEALEDAMIPMSIALFAVGSLAAAAACEKRAADDFAAANDHDDD